MWRVISVTSGVLVVLVLLAEERELLEEPLEAGIGLTREQLGRDARQLLEVLDPPLRLDVRSASSSSR